MIKIKYTEKQRAVLQGITSAQFGFTNSDGKAVNSVLNNINKKFSPFPKKTNYSKSLKYYEAHALVVISRILIKDYADEPLIASTCSQLISQIEPKL